MEEAVVVMRVERGEGCGGRGCEVVILSKEVVVAPGVFGDFAMQFDSVLRGPWGGLQTVRDSRSGDSSCDLREPWSLHK